MAETLDLAQMLGTNFEPKRKFRWILAIDGIDAFTLKAAARPTFSTDPIEMGYINNTRYIAGKTKPGTIAITLYDSIDPSASQKIMEWLRLCYDPATGRAGFGSMYKKDITLKMLDGSGLVVELWDIRDAFPTEINWGDLSYEDSAPAEIAITLQPGRCILQY